MSETRLVWVLSKPSTSEINNAMQEPTREQHKDLSVSSQKRVAGFDFCSSKRDADAVIAQTAVSAALKPRAVLVGDDTNLLVLLLYHYQQGVLYFMSEPKTSSSSSQRFLNMQEMCWVTMFATTSYFVHAMLDCGTTSRLFGAGEEVSLHLVQGTGS